MAAVRSPVFRRPGCRRHAGTTDGHPKLPPRRRWQAVIAPCDPTSHTLIHTARCTQHHGGSDSPAPPPGCDLGGTPPRPPRMSPRPRVAKYGATHGCHPLPGIEITSPLHCTPRSLRRSNALPRSACRRKRAQKRRARGHALVTKKFTYYELLFNCLNSFGGAIGEGGYHDVHALKRLE